MAAKHGEREAGHQEQEHGAKPGLAAPEQPLSGVSTFPSSCLLLPGRNNLFPILLPGVPGVPRVDSLPLVIPRVLVAWDKGKTPMDTGSTLHHG